MPKPKLSPEEKTRRAATSRKIKQLETRCTRLKAELQRLLAGDPERVTIILTPAGKIREVVATSNVTVVGARVRAMADVAGNYIGADIIELQPEWKMGTYLAAGAGHRHAQAHRERSWEK